jgi:nucleotide-binding universal stress UspA family protein
MGDSIGKIIVAIDGSDGAKRAAAFAGILAKATGAAVHLLLVHDPDVYVISGPGEAAWISSDDYTHLIEGEIGENLRKNVADPAFAAAREALGNVGGQVSEEVIWGHPAETVCRTAEKMKADLIVVGSRGRSAFTELVLGSVSGQILHHAPCPVTVVR